MILGIATVVALAVGVFVPLRWGVWGFLGGAAMVFAVQAGLNTALGFAGTSIEESLLLFGGSWGAYLGWNVQITYRAFALPLLGLGAVLVWRQARAQMSTEAKQHSDPAKASYPKGGLVLVLLALVFSFPLIFWSVDIGVLEEFLALKMNEQGDTLAGYFGSLAFALAAFAVFLQSRELAAQREELQLTRKAMEKQSKATQQMAKTMAIQAQIFEDEQLARDQSRVKELLGSLEESINLKLQKLSQDARWKFDLDVPTIQGGVMRSSVSTAPLNDVGHGHMPSVVPYAIKRIIDFSDLLSGDTRKANLTGSPSDVSDYSDLLQDLEKILQLSDRLSAADQQYLRNCNFEEFSQELSLLMERLTQQEIAK